jgi:hypothetical protein
MELKLFRNLFGEIVEGNAGTAVSNPFYALYGEMRVEKIPGSGTYTKTIGWTLDPGEAMGNFFVLNSGFRGYFLSPHFNPYGVTEITKVSHNILKGKFFRGQFYGDPPEVQGALTEAGNYVVLKGGVRYQGNPQDKINEIAAGRFLTYHPEIKTVGLTQPEILHFLVAASGITTVNLRAKVTYTDGSETTITAKTLTGVTQWDLLRMPAGIIPLGLSSIDFAKTINYYELFLTNQSGTVISDRRFYELDQYDQPWERFWMYENGLGMPEVFRTIGKVKTTQNIAIGSAKKAVTYDTDFKEAGIITNRAIYRGEEEVSTGHLRDRETAAYMLDLLTQKAPLYELRDNDYFPKHLTGPEAYEEAMDEEYNYFLRFRVSDAYENESY